MKLTVETFFKFFTITSDTYKNSMIYSDLIAHLTYINRLSYHHVVYIEYELQKSIMKNVIKRMRIILDNIDLLKLILF